MMMNATTLNHEGHTSYECGSSISPLSGSLANKQVATLAFLQDTYDRNEPHQLTLQTAKAIVTSADALEQALKKSGRSCDPNLAMQWVMTNHTVSLEIAAREQAEKRGYIYDNCQKGTSFHDLHGNCVPHKHALVRETQSRKDGHGTVKCLGHRNSVAN
jgi:hypothetical protein